MADFSPTDCPIGVQMVGCSVPVRLSFHALFPIHAYVPDLHIQGQGNES